MSDSTVSPWPRRAAWLACLATFPIFLIGGTVTTLRVGMAVPDWPTTFGQNMFTYPLSEMLGNTGVFWEHSHRLWGAFVGLCIVALTLAVALGERRPGVRWLAFFALLGVIGQGVLGGLRVTENSPELAFLHGSLAQALFALLAAILFLESRAFTTAPRVEITNGAKLRVLSALALGLVYVQTGFGAWLRHSGLAMAQAIHVLFAIVATWIVVVLAIELRRSGLPELERIARWLRALVWTQVTLGILAWISVYVLTGPHNPVSISEAVFATAHVACGALLLSACVAALVFVRRPVASRSVDVGVDHASASRLGTAR